jgi:hypothetical protein
MKLYKPFEYLFYRIESFYEYTGVGGHHSQVSGLIAAMQWIYIMVLGSLITDIFGLKFRYLYCIIILMTLAIFNMIYFKDEKIREIFRNYNNISKGKHRIFGILVLIYIFSPFFVIIYFGIKTHYIV